MPQESIASQQSLLDELPIAAYLCGADGLITAFNDEAAQLWGRAPELPIPCWPATPAQAPDGATISLDDHAVMRAIRSKAPQSQFIDLVRPDGHRLPVRLQCKPRIDREGRVTSVLTTISHAVEASHQPPPRESLPISSPQAAAPAFVSAEEPHAAPSQPTGLPITSERISLWEWSVASDEWWQSSDWRSQLGACPPGAIQGQGDWRGRIHPSDKNRVLSALRRQLTEDHHQLAVEHRLQQPDGSYRWVYTNAATYRDDAGAVQRLIGCHVDIDLQTTSNRTLDQLLRSALETTGRQYFQKLVEFLSTSCRVEIVGVAEFSDETPDVARTLALWEDGAIGKNLTYRLAGTPCQTLYDPQQTEPCYFTEVQECFPTDPMLVTLGVHSYAGIPLRDSSGNPIGLIFLLSRDAQDAQHNASILKVVGARCAAELERERAERAVRSADLERKRLEHRVQQAEKLESLGVLAGGVAHDFNNFLAAIISYAEIAKMATTDAQAASAIDEVIRGAECATDLTKQLLAYSGRAEADMGLINLTQVVAETDRLLRASVPENCEITLDLQDDLPDVLGDAAQLRQLLMNLLLNASDSIGASQGRIRVSTEFHEQVQRGEFREYAEGELPTGPFVRLDVSDNGCGMDDETRRRVFDPFYTTKCGHHGLGLSTSLGIIRSHGGAIAVESRPGIGTTFHTLLPVATRAAAPDAPPNGVAEPLPLSGAVLLADDDASVAHSTSLLLTAIGMEVVTVSDGAEAVREFAADPDRFALVILDHAMPVMDGAQASQHMRDLRPDAKIVIMSGYREVIASSRSLQADGVQFLKKPFRLQQLRNTIAETTT